MDRISSIELAIKNESTEMEYYLNQARRSKNPVAKLLFQTLAADEKEHMVRLKALHERLVANGDWPEDVPLEVAGTNIKNALKSLARDHKSTTEHNADDVAALKQSAEYEKSGAQFYAELARQCTQPVEAQFFNFLAEIEREHMLSINDSLYYLEDPQGWLQRNGKTGLDG